jgi:hypothetical protein
VGAQRRASDPDADGQTALEQQDAGAVFGTERTTGLWIEDAERPQTSRFSAP